MAGKLRGGRVKSIKELKSSIKKNDGGGYLTRVPADGSLTVRFLTEPDEWIEYFEHYNDTDKFFPCTDGCPACAENPGTREGRPTKRYLVNAIDTAENRVIPLALPKSLASSVMKKYDKFNTLLDRDYELTREGSGLETEYDAIPEPPTKMNLGRFDPLDLVSLLEAQIPGGSDSDDDDDDDDDEDTRPVKRSKRTSRPVGKRRPAARDDDDDDDDDEEDEPVRKTMRRPVKKAVEKPAPVKKVRPVRKPVRR